MDDIDRHNRAKIDMATETLVGLAARAVRAVPTGSLTIKLEWRNHLLSRLVTNEEVSQMLAVAPREHT